jgi:hypothetical protein
MTGGGKTLKLNQLCPMRLHIVDVATTKVFNFFYSIITVINILTSFNIENVASQLNKKERD